MPVRDAVADDIEEICALIEEHAVYEDKHDLKLDRQEMAGFLFGPDPKAWVLIATPPDEPGKVAGFATLISVQQGISRFRSSELTS